MQTVVVIGATGRVGEPVARGLAAEGYAVRVFTRDEVRARRMFDPSFDVARGDVEDVASLERAMEGCAGAHISLDGRGDWDLERRGAERIVEAAVGAGLKRITLTSGASTCEANAWFPMTRAKLGAEQAVRHSGIPYTIFRCTMFMETLPAFVREGRAMVMGAQPALWHWVAASDYGAMVAAAHGSAAAAGKTLYVYGPEPLTIERALRQYRAVCAPAAKLGYVPFWVLAVMALLPGRVELRRIGLPLMRYFARVREMGDAAEADALLGKPGTTLAQWCQARARGERSRPVPDAAAAPAVQR